jgi:tRNA pseudouridine32 synthase/23S rRNA pseudouridine746 synthase
MRLLFLNPHVAVLAKPPGVPFHTDAKVAGGAPGAVALARALPELAGGPLHPVHRLDAATSGAMVFARSDAVARELLRAFAERRVVKYYVALSARRPSRKMGTIAGDMVKSRRGSWALARTRANAAVTRFASAGAGVAGRPGLRAFVLKPETGRTHQVRRAARDRPSVFDRSENEKRSLNQPSAPASSASR